MTSPRSRLRPADIARVGAVGLRTRPLRVFLSALGIAIGIAAMIAVVGVATSADADLARRLDALGTNLLRVSPGQTLQGGKARLPAEAIAMIRHIPAVESVTATGLVRNARVYRTDHVPAAESGGITVLAARPDLLGPVGAAIAHGQWLNPSTQRYPVVVLGAVAARRLGIIAPGAGVQIWLGRQWFTVVGILTPVPLAAELDVAALVGWPAASEQLGFDGSPTTVYTRTAPDAVTAVRSILAATANPEHPNEVQVSRPSDALAAQYVVDTTLNRLLLGLGAIALLVGGIGVANTMVISVLERRVEIGLRRALGATRGHIRAQFVTESLLLSLLGGTGGVVLGVAVTTAYAWYQGWPALIPAWATTGALVATLTIGTAAGLYPAWRAARVPPTEALATP